MRKIFTIFAALTLSVGLWADGSVITYKATEKLETQFAGLGSVVSHEWNESTGEGTVTYSSTVTTIGWAAFMNCFSLESVELPASLTTIGEFAFNACNFQTITIPASVTTIGMQAFGGCSNSTSVTFLGNACQNAIGEDAFDQVGFSYNPATLNLPNDWTGSKPAQDGSRWYGGYFKLPAPATVKATYIDENGASQEVDAIEITNASATLAAGWYVVNGADIQTSTLVCEGEVHLILADGAKLTATGESKNTGIQVSGEGNSLTIYAQSIGDQMGQLIAAGGNYAAGIGGGNMEKGSNITINGGIVTANGGNNASGIGGGSNGDCSNITINGGIVTATGGDKGAGIGGGLYCSGSNITINGGTVTATGGDNGAGIGNGEDAFFSSNIFVATSLVVKADNNNPPTTVIENGGNDLASKLAGKRYVMVETPAAPAVGDTFEDATSGLKFEVTAVEETPTVRVIANNYTGTTYTIPDTVKYNGVDFAVTEIGEYAFNDCESLQSVTLPEGLLTIGEGAFYFSGLTSITIPAGVTTIGVYAFSYCTDLASVTFEGTACQDAIGEMAFYGVGETAPAALTLPDTWTGTVPDEEGNWYDGKFELVSGPTALPTVFGDGVKGNKFMHKGHLIIRSGNKKYNALGF